jgi:hypothetical protein
MDAAEALWHIVDGHGLLFVGAGFSRAATNLKNEPFKSASEFADALAARLDFPVGTPLSYVADEFAAVNGDDALIKELSQEFTVRDVAKHQVLLANLPWRRVYTTNYDNVMEAAYARNGRKLVPATTSDDVRNLPKHDTICVHLNGFIDRLNRESIHRELKLTDRSYLADALPDSPWAVMFRQDVLVAKCVVFVGYSLADLDVSRLLFQTSSIAAKCFFVLDPATAKATVRRAEGFGTVLHLTAAEFARQADEVARSFQRVEAPNAALACFRPFLQGTDVEAFSDERVFELFLWGRTNSRLEWQSLHGGPRYILERNGVADVIELLKSGLRAVVVHSHLGNGKSIAIDGIKCRAADEGFDVFELAHRTPDLLMEADTILKRAPRPLFVVEEYPDWLDLVRYVTNNGGDHAAMVLSARTPAHDVLIDDLCDALRTDGVHEINVERLTDAEVEWFAETFDHYGLWGKHAGLSRRAKNDLLSRDCRRQMHAILLTVFDAPQILSRLDNLLRTLDSRRDYYDVMIGILILTVLNRSFSVNVLVDLSDRAVVTDSRFRQNAVVRQLVDFKSGEISVRSAVAAQYVLRRVANTDTVIDVLGRLARRADKAAAAVPYYRDVLKTFMRFSNIQLLLGEKESGPAAMRLYESIKGLHGCQRHPLFWLQYAIASLFTNDLVRSEKYFDTAYALARERSETTGVEYDTRQIDNHYARHLLKAAIDTHDTANAMRSFRKARKIVNDQMARERLHYPYRVARIYGEFFDEFEGVLSGPERSEVGQAAAYVLERIGKLDRERQRQRYVRDCRDVMEYVVERSKEATVRSSGPPVSPT